MCDMFLNNASKRGVWGKRRSSLWLRSISLTDLWLRAKLSNLLERNLSESILWTFTAVVNYYSRQFSHVSLHWEPHTSLYSGLIFTHLFICICLLVYFILLLQMSTVTCRRAPEGRNLSICTVFGLLVMPQPPVISPREHWFSAILSQCSLGAHPLGLSHHSVRCAWVNASSCNCYSALSCKHWNLRCSLYPHSWDWLTWTGLPSG